ncbi:MAG: PAS domain-containing protein [Deltaproteobacteria bacterium]|nr:PAS domain-containing protein [Deltaproteobacteria bacterium]
MTDNTSLKQLELERDRLRTIFENLMDGVFIADRNFIIEYMNRDLRYEFGDGMGKPCHEFFGLSPTNCLHCYEGMSAFGPPQRLEWSSLLTGRTYDMLVSPLPNPDGTTSRLHILRDVTEQKRMEARLLDYSEALEKRITEQAEALRRQEHMALLGQIAAGLAHEIRTPLGALLTGIKLLEKSEEQNPERRHILTLLRQETLRLKEKLSQFLNYASPREPKLSLGSVPDLIEDAVSLLDKDPELRGEVSIRHEAAPEQEKVAFDPSMLKEAILNVAVNSLQALAGQGELQIRSFQAQERQWIQISDSGPGINPQDLEKVFQPFFTRKRGGSGLGLAIALRIMEEHGGTINARSIPGQGATFTISWPIKTATPSNAQLPAATQSSSREQAS